MLGKIPPMASRRCWSRLFSLFSAVTVCFFYLGKTTCMVGLFSPLKFLLSGALAGGNAVNAPD